MMKAILLFLMTAVFYPGKRQVLLFYNQSGREMCNKQITILNKDKQDLSDRDIEIYIYDIIKDKSFSDKWNINSTMPFIFLLIGKDGGEKMRSDTIVTKKQLLSIIDAMPMRKEEMKQGN